jgi:hypothetical protein
MPVENKKIFSSPLLDPRSGMDKYQDPGYGINISDPQHCEKQRAK